MTDSSSAQQTKQRYLLVAVSAVLAITYGVFGSRLYEAAPPYVIGAAFKASGIVILGLIAFIARSRLLAAGLFFGALGDAFLAWSPDTFLLGAAAFLIGHLFYIALFLRAGIGYRGVLRQPIRIAGMLVILTAALLMTSALAPHDSPLYAPLSVYTGVLTIMTMCSLTLPWPRWLATLGAMLFFISDGFVAWNTFHPDNDPTLSFWRSFAGWIIYWAGQAGIGYGALGLHKAVTRT